MPHEHPIIDTDRYFTIDPYSRTITYESDAELALVQFDHNSERFTFELPRYIEEHDMSLCNKVRVHYMNVGSGGRNSDVYEVSDLKIDPEDDSLVICSWLISQNATLYAGTLDFVIQYICMTDDVIDYAWHTTVFSGVKILNGMSNTEVIAEEYADALEQWFLRLEEAAIVIDPTNAVKAVDEAKAAAIGEINKAVNILDPANAVKAVDEAKAAAIGEINKAAEALDPDAAIQAVDEAKKEAIDELNKSVDELGLVKGGVYGNITVNFSDFIDTDYFIVDIADFKAKNAIFFAPREYSTAQTLAKYGCYIHIARPGVVRFAFRETVPSTDSSVTNLNLSYYITDINNETEDENAIFASLSEVGGGISSNSSSDSSSNDSATARIMYGAYQGGGKYGESQPNEIVFDFEPRMVFLYRESYAPFAIPNYIEDTDYTLTFGPTNAVFYNVEELVDEESLSFIVGVDENLNDVYLYYSFTTSGGVTRLSWYTESNATKQYNRGNTIYHWIAIG